MARRGTLLRKGMMVFATTLSVAGLVCWIQLTPFYGEANVKPLKVQDAELSNSITRNSKSSHKFPGDFNLMEEASRYTGALLYPPKTCSLELMNGERLQQDHPCVLNNIRQFFLKSPSTEPLNLEYPDIRDRSGGHSEAITYLLNNKTNGFFIECGALDGENLSNTLYMERYLNWTGLLIEADQDVFKNLLSKKRKSWASPTCLSDDPYPQEVKFIGSYALGQVDSERLPARNLSGQTGSSGREMRVQCFPIYSLLLAIGRTEIDYFSLDIEQHEFFVLKTIPFHKLNITVLSVEIMRTSDEMFALYEDMVDYMKLQGYDLIHPRKVGYEAFFIRSDYVKSQPYMSAAAKNLK